MTPFKTSERKSYYTLEREATDAEIIQFAHKLLSRRFRKGRSITSPEHSKDYLISKLAEREQEVFSVIFMDNKHRILSYEELFYGTIDAAAVYPREVVKRALALNAAALIVAHNHPSGDPEPSISDDQITNKLVQALKLVDIRLLDHIVVGAGECISYAQRGMI